MEPTEGGGGARIFSRAPEKRAPKKWRVRLALEVRTPQFGAPLGAEDPSAATSSEDQVSFPAAAAAYGKPQFLTALWVSLEEVSPRSPEDAGERSGI